jgi:G6PDH family F420-dependent oxidoreductase
MPDRSAGTTALSHVERSEEPRVTVFGYFLSSEEYRPQDLLEQARMAEAAGFESLWVSDHFHPWLAEQGHSPFVWSTIGALSQVSRLPVATAVTCPTVRIHPAIIAQAAATSAVLHEGRFRLGVGSGEALNEHILGDPWPPTDTRLAMLEESVQLIRELWSGEDVTFEGDYYTVQHARIYTRPDTPPPVLVSGFGPKAAALAGRIGDGFVCMKPDAALVRAFRDAGGGDKVAGAGIKCCWSRDPEEGLATAHQRWRIEALPGELAQVLPYPQHFQQAGELVPARALAGSVPTGPDPQPYLDTVAAYLDAGYQELYFQQIGPQQQEFFTFAEQELLPRLRGA